MSRKSASSCCCVTALFVSYSVKPAPTAQAVLGMIRTTALPGTACSMAAMVTPAAMDTSRGLFSRAVRVGRSCASTPGSRWGFTPRKMQPQEEAMVSASAQWAPSSAASASALAIVRLLRKTSVGDTVLTSARASAPPMLPVPINPYVMVCTSFPFFPIIIHPPPERNRKKAARVREKPSRDQLRNGFCYVSMV